MLSVLLLAPLLLQEGPVQEPPTSLAQTEFEMAWKAQAAAPGLRLEMELRFEETGSDGEQEVSRIHVVGAVAKPAAGSLKLRLVGDEDDPVQEMEVIGTGASVQLVSHQDQITMLLGETWREAPLDLAHLLGAWAGAPPPSSQDVESLRHEVREDWTGFRYRLVDDADVYTVWFDADGRWVESIIQDRKDSRLVILVEQWELLEEVDEKALRVALPEGYATGVEWLPEDRVDSAEKDAAASGSAGAFPDASPAAREFLLDRLADYSNAGGLDLSLSLSRTTSASSASVDIRGQVAKPAWGHLEASIRESRFAPDGSLHEVERSFLASGDGAQVRVRDLADGRDVVATRTGWTKTGWLDGVLLFDAWLGEPLPVMRDLSFASVPAEAPAGWRGVQWFDEDEALHELWFDAEGRFVRSRVERELGAHEWVITLVDAFSARALTAAELDALRAPAAVDRTAVEPRLPAHDPQLYPDADGEALADLLDFQQRCAAAAALHFVAEGTLRGPDMRAELRMSVAVARPALGRFEATALLHATDAPEDAPPQEKRGVYVGDGERITAKLGEDSYTAGRWKEAEVGEGVLPFAAWAGIGDQPRIGVAYADADEAFPDCTGIRYRSKEGSMHTLWFDPTGLLAGFQVVEGVDAAMTVLRMRVSGFRLERTIDPQAWKASD